MKRLLSWALGLLLMLSLCAPASALTPTPTPVPTPMPTPPPTPTPGRKGPPMASISVGVDGEWTSINWYILVGQYDGMYIDGFPPHYMLWQENVKAIRVQPDAQDIRVRAAIDGAAAAAGISRVVPQGDGSYEYEPITDGLAQLGEGAWPIVVYTSYSGDGAYYQYCGVFWLLVGDDARVPEEAEFAG